MTARGPSSVGLIWPREPVGSFTVGHGDFTDRQLVMLRTISLAVATISVVASLLAIYWFLRMTRRNFRHE